MTKRPSVFHKILAATATPEKTDGAVVTAARLARRQKAWLKIVHTEPLLKFSNDDGRLFVHPTPESTHTKKNSTSMAGKMFTRYSEIFPELRNDDILIVPGVAWETIFRTAVQWWCDLIVVGPHTQPSGTGDMPKSGRFLGSTADGVIRQACCPVLIANRAFDSDQLAFANILVGVDFSTSCASAICLAALIARRHNASISTFHMLPIAPYPKYTPQAVQADRMRLQKRMNAICNLLLEGIGHQFYLKPGARPDEELLQFSQNFGADLIILGSHTKEKAGKWYAGSVVQRLACHSQCPVMVVSGLEALTPWKDVPFIYDRFSKVEPHLLHFPS